MPALFRHRHVPLPTLWGWLAVLALLGGAAVVIGRSLGGWLAVSEPVSAALGGPAHVLVVEGWLLAPELDAAAAYARARGYGQVVTSGSPIDEPFSTFANYAERAATALRPQLNGLAVDAAPVAMAPRQNRTYATAVGVREWARRNGVRVDAIDVYSIGAHARRTRLLYAMAFGKGTQVGIVAGTPYDADPLRWWTTSEAAKSVMGETISLAWTVCCFWPPPPGPHDALPAIPSSVPPAASTP
jgi:hypothetical protein